MITVTWHMKDYRFADGDWLIQYEQRDHGARGVSRLWTWWERDLRWRGH